MSGTICFLSAAHPAEDKRVFHKEARSLAAAGFEVTHLCPGEGQRSYEHSGVQIREYPRRGAKWARLFGLAALYSRARAIGADAYHCNEPDSWVVGIALRYTTGAKVVFDCHEHYPGQVVRWLPRGFRAVGSITTAGLLQLLGLMTHLLVLAKPSVAPDFSLSKRRQILVLNTTSLQYMPTDDPELHATRDADAPFTFVHFGVFRRERGSEQLLAALKLLRDRGVTNVRVRLIGQFTDGSEDDFNAKAKDLGIDHLIESHSWMPFEEAFRLVSGSDAGLVLFQKGIENNVRGMPHKMFDYMLAGIPVIAPEFAPDIAHVIGPSQAGLLIDTSKPEDFADAMQRLMDDRAWARQLGRNGREAVISTYNWETEAAKLVAAYTSLLKRGRGNARSLGKLTRLGRRARTSTAPTGRSTTRASRWSTRRSGT